MHAKFIYGITGVVRDDHGRVLLRHRLWPPDRQWGFPTGYADKGERHEDTIAREVREETGLTDKAGRLLKVRSGFRHRIEVYYEAVLVGGLDGLTLDPRRCSKPAFSAPATCQTGCSKRTRNSPTASELLTGQRCLPSRQGYTGLPESPDSGEIASPLSFRWGVTRTA